MNNEDYCELYADFDGGWQDPMELADDEYRDWLKRQPATLEVEVALLMLDGASPSDIEGVLADFFED